jgi:hypothetical protein
MDENRLSPARCGRTRRSTTVAGPQGVAALAAPAGPDRAEPGRAAPKAARAPAEPDRAAAAPAVSTFAVPDRAAAAPTVSTFAVPDFSVPDFAVPNGGVPGVLAMVGVALLLLMSATLPAALQRM